MAAFIKLFSEALFAPLFGGTILFCGWLCYRIFRFKDKKAFFIQAFLLFLIICGSFVHLGSTRYLLVAIFPCIAGILWMALQIASQRKCYAVMILLILIIGVINTVKVFRLIRTNCFQQGILKVIRDSQERGKIGLINTTGESHRIYYFSGCQPICDRDFQCSANKDMSHQLLHSHIQRYKYCYDTLYFFFWQKKESPDFSPAELGLTKEQWVRIYRSPVKKEGIDLCIFRYVREPPPTGCQGSFVLPRSTRRKELEHPRWRLNPDFFIIEGRNDVSSQVKSTSTQDGKYFLELSSPTQAAARTCVLDIGNTLELTFAYQSYVPQGKLEIDLVRVDLPTLKKYKDDKILIIPLNDLEVHRARVMILPEMICADEYIRILFRICAGSVRLFDFSLRPLPDGPYCKYEENN